MRFLFFFTFALGNLFQVANAVLPSSGIISKSPTELGLVVFDGISIDQTVEYGSTKLDIYHNRVTGQISGTGSFSIENIPYSDRQVSTDSISGSGTAKFSAKVLKRGSIVSLSGAKLTTNVTGSGTVYVYDYGDAPFTVSSAGTFIFRTFNIDTSSSAPKLTATLAAGRLTITGSAWVNGRLMKKTAGFPYLAQDFSESIDPQSLAESLVGLDVSLSGLVTDSKGKVTGFAGSLLDCDEIKPKDYTVSCLRDKKTGVSTLTLMGQGNSKGTSATVNVNDSLKLQSSGSYKNKNLIKVYGYSVSF